MVWPMSKVVKHCSLGYSFSNEDQRDYIPGWITNTSRTTGEEYEELLDSFVYHTQTELEGEYLIA